MEERYYVVKLLTNTQGQDASSISVFLDDDKALVEYHRTLANFHNADDVLYAVVKIVNIYGNAELMEIVNHVPEPEPNEKEE